MPIESTNNGIHSETWKLREDTTQVEFAKQDWFTFPSTPKFYLPSHSKGFLASSARNQSTSSIIQAQEGIKNGIIGTKASKASGPKDCSTVPSTPQIPFSHQGRNARKKLRKLLEQGIPKNEASELCLMSWPDIIRKIPSMIAVAPNKRKAEVESQTSAQNPNIAIETRNKQNVNNSQRSAVNQIPVSTRASKPRGPKDCLTVPSTSQIPFSCQGKNTRKKLRKLVEHGVPKNEATELCLMSWPDIIQKIPSMIAVAPNTRKAEVESQTHAKTPKNANDTRNIQHSSIKGQRSPEVNQIQISKIKEQKSLNLHDTAPLRIGIRNLEPMDEEQMKMVHRHLILAIRKQFTKGGGPEFLSFTHKSGWILVTCVDQRSLDWLVGEVQDLEPWPGALLSVIPEAQLPNPPKVVAMIPSSEADSIQEALDLLKAQNKGLNTEHWQVLHERVEQSKNRTLTFIIDEQSLETLRSQNLQVALGFQIVTFRIKAVGSQFIRQPVIKDQDSTPNSILNCSKSEGSESLTYTEDEEAHSSSFRQSHCGGNGDGECWAPLPQAGGTKLVTQISRSPFNQEEGGTGQGAPLTSTKGLQAPRGSFQVPKIGHGCIDSQTGETSFSQVGTGQAKSIIQEEGIRPQAAGRQNDDWPVFQEDSHTSWGEPSEVRCWNLQTCIQWDKKKTMPNQSGGEIIALTEDDHDNDIRRVAASENLAPARKNCLSHGEGSHVKSKVKPEEKSDQNDSTLKKLSSEPTRFGARPVFQNCLSQGGVAFEVSRGTGEVSQRKTIVANKESKSIGYGYRSWDVRDPPIVMAQDSRPGDTASHRNVSALTTNETPRHRDLDQPIRDSQNSGTLVQNRNEELAPVERHRSSSPTENEEGGYKSWIIQDPESFAAGIISGQSLYNPAVGPFSELRAPPISPYVPAIQDPEGIKTPYFSQDSRGRSLPDWDRPSMSDRTLSPSARSGTVTHERHAGSSHTQDSRGDRDRDMSLRSDRSLSPQVRNGYVDRSNTDSSSYGRRYTQASRLIISDSPRRSNGRLSLGKDFGGRNHQSPRSYSKPFVRGETHRGRHSMASPQRNTQDSRSHSARSPYGHENGQKRFNCQKDTDSGRGQILREREEYRDRRKAATRPKVVGERSSVYRRAVGKRSERR